MRPSHSIGTVAPSSSDWRMVLVSTKSWFYLPVRKVDLRSAHFYHDMFCDTLGVGMLRAVGQVV